MKPTEEIMTFEKSGNSSDQPTSELDRLREENKRLKRTLVERFDHTFQ
jgi:hypothetical protein